MARSTLTKANVAEMIINADIPAKEKSDLLISLELGRELPQITNTEKLEKDLKNLDMKFKEFTELVAEPTQNIRFDLIMGVNMELMASMDNICRFARESDNISPEAKAKTKSKIGGIVNECRMLIMKHLSK